MMLRRERTERVCLTLLVVLSVVSFGLIPLGLGWFALGGILLLPAWIVYVAARIAGVFRGPVAAPGCCRGCGYDLAGNMNEICPECGEYN